MEFKDRLKEKRLEKGFTLEELATRIGTSKQTIHRYESGVISNIPSDKIEALAEALETTPSFLMGWEDAPAPVYEVAAGEGRINGDYATDDYCVRLDDDEWIATVRGTSMFPTLHDGDKVIVCAQSVPDYDGQMCLVKINGDQSTIKRVEVKENGILLVADNTSVYPPRLYTVEQVEQLPVTIEGIVIRLIRELR